MSSVSDKLLDNQVLQYRDGLLEPSRRWHAGMARSAQYFYEQQEKNEDVRLSICKTLLDTCGSDLDDSELVDAIAIMMTFHQ